MLFWGLLILIKVYNVPQNPILFSKALVLDKFGEAEPLSSDVETCSVGSSVLARQSLQGSVVEFRTSELDI